MDSCRLPFHREVYIMGSRLPVSMQRAGCPYALMAYKVQFTAYMVPDTLSAVPKAIKVLLYRLKNVFKNTACATVCAQEGPLMSTAHCYKNAKHYL